jgi:hypothetical protein
VASLRSEGVDESGSSSFGWDNAAARRSTWTLGIASVLRWLQGVLFSSTRIEVRSRFSLEESVARLRTATRRWASLDAWISQSAVGTVSAEKVSLQRSIPFFSNGFKPFFYGRFVQVQDGVVLAGHFSMRRATQIFMCFWLGFCLLWTAGAALAVLTHPVGAPTILPFAGLGMFVLGIGFVVLAKSLSQGDIKWLSKVLQDALGGVT